MRHTHFLAFVGLGISLVMLFISIAYVMPELVKNAQNPQEVMQVATAILYLGLFCQIGGVALAGINGPAWAIFAALGAALAFPMGMVCLAGTVFSRNNWRFRKYEAVSSFPPGVALVFANRRKEGILCFALAALSILIPGLYLSIIIFPACLFMGLFIGVRRRPVLVIGDDYLLFSHSPAQNPRKLPYAWVIDAAPDGNLFALLVRLPDGGNDRIYIRLSYVERQFQQAARDALTRKMTELGVLSPAGAAS